MKKRTTRGTAALGLLFPVLGACGPLFTIEPGEGEGEGEGECDVDGDGIDCAFDCDDADADAGSNVDDADCDGVPSFSDCNDFDPDVAVAVDGDADCDGVDADDDCNDSDPFVGDRAADADCDGFATADDCDDADPASTARFEDGDCDGTVNFNDCDDANPAVGANFNDNDCDGVASGDDCNDFDASVGENDLDGDCDGASDVDEAACGTDPLSGFSVPADLDADGTCDSLDADADGDGAQANDCDDLDAAVRPGAAEVDLDGKDNNCDGDFGRDIVVDAALTTGGAYRSVAATADRLFLARTSSVDVYDRTTSALLGAIDLSPVGSVAVANDQLFVATFDRDTFLGALHVVDPVSLAVLASAPARSDRIFASDGAVFDAFCAVRYDFADNAITAREVLESGATSCTAVGERTAAVVESNLVIVDADGGVSAPAALPTTAGFSRRVLSDGATVFVVSFDSVASYDVSGDAPALLNTLTTVQGVDVGGEGAALLDADTLLAFDFGDSFIINVADPSNLALVRTGGGLDTGAVLAGESAFGLDRGGLLETSVTATAVGVATARQGIESRDVTGLLLEGNTAHLIGDGAFSSFVAARPTAELGGRFVGASSVPVTLRQGRTLDTTGPALFDAVFDAVAIVDVSSGAPVVTTLDDGSFGFLVGGATANGTAVTAVEFFDETTVSTWDLSTSPPTRLGSVVEPQPLNGLALVAGVLFAIDGNNQIVAYPERTPTDLGAPVVIPTIGTPSVILGRGNVLYHATSEGFFGARVIDDVNAPGAVAGSEICSFSRSLTLTADRAYVGGSECLSVLSLADPVAPAHVVDARVSANVAVTVAGDLVGVIGDGAVFLRDTTR